MVPFRLANELDTGPIWNLDSPPNSPANLSRMLWERTGAYFDEKKLYAKLSGTKNQQNTNNKNTNN